MTGSIQGTGSQPSVDYGSTDIGQTQGTRTVGRGMIGDDARLQMMQGEKAVTHSQLAHRPTLIKPETMGARAQVAAANAASEDLTGLGQTTRAASAEVGSTMMRIQTGQQSPADAQWLLRNATSFEGAADYLKSLQTGADKPLLLGGQGFDDGQIADLLDAQKNPAALTERLEARYGSGLGERQQQLKNMGYDDRQITMILSLGRERIASNEGRQAELMNRFKDNSAGQKLASLGFDEKQIKALLALANKGTAEAAPAGSQKVHELLVKMGFNDSEARVLLASADQDKLKNQGMLLRQLESNPGMAARLSSLAQESRLLAQQPNKPYAEEHLKQLADIFMVLQLIHQMSVEQRRFAREARSAEYDAAKAEVLKQADHIRDAATYTLIADMAQGGMSLMGGMMSMRGGMKGGMKGPKGGKSGATADDVQVSSPSSKKSGAGGKGKKSRSSASQDGVEQNSQSTQQSKASQKQQNVEKDVYKAEQKQADRETEAQLQDAAGRKQNREAVTESQNKEIENNQAQAKTAGKSQENSNEMMMNSNSGMMFSQVTGAMGNLAAAPFKFMATEEQALQKESEAHQKSHENAAQAWSEWMQLQQDQVKNCQSKIEEITRIHFDTLKSLSRG